MIDHLWQSTVFGLAAWLLTLALRTVRAEVRYWIWFAASLKFLVPFSLLVGVGEIAPQRAAVAPMVQTEWVVAAEQIGRPLAVPPAAPKPADHTELPWAIWACGFAVMLCLYGRKWTRMSRIVRAAQLLRIDFPIPVRESATLYEPGVFGAFRPVLLLPEGIAAKLKPAQFQAILAHELCHVRRRDNLTAAIHMLIQSAFWFHPLLWWIGSRLIDERERACDEEVLRLGSAPADYAEGILNVCKFYAEAPPACVAGVTGAELKKRIEAIMKNRVLQQLTMARKILLAGAGLIAAGVPVMIGFMHAPAARAQPTPTQVPKWEAVSIRRCEAPPPNRGGRGGIDSSSEGRYWLECGKVEGLIRGGVHRLRGRPEDQSPRILRNAFGRSFMDPQRSLRDRSQARRHADSRDDEGADDAGAP